MGLWTPTGDRHPTDVGVSRRRSRRPSADAPVLAAVPRDSGRRRSAPFYGDAPKLWFVAIPPDDRGRFVVSSRVDDPSDGSITLDFGLRLPLAPRAHPVDRAAGESAIHESKNHGTACVPVDIVSSG